jgi:hypothetical protein
MQCTATTRSGKRCGANSLRGKRRCLLHSSQGKAQELGRRGGTNGRRVSRPELLQLAAPQTAQDVRALLGQSLFELRAGKLTPTLAYAVASLSTAFLRALDAGDYEARLVNLENFREEFNKRRRQPN